VYGGAIHGRTLRVPVQVSHVDLDECVQQIGMDGHGGGSFVIDVTGHVDDLGVHRALNELAGVRRVRP
jgi:hypothetical protein